MRILRHLVAASLALGLAAQSVDARSFAKAPAETAAHIESSQRARLKKVLAKRRAKNLSAFQAYVSRQQYPHNAETPGELNIWIDTAGRRCAAAQMIWASGAKQLVAEQAELDNYIRLANVTEGALNDWILTSGLTHDEVVLIQRPFVGRPQQGELAKPVDSWQVTDRAMFTKYRGILAELRRTNDASLDAAVDALMEHPDLATAVMRATR